MTREEAADGWAPGKTETTHIHRTDASILYVGVEKFHLCKTRVQSVECALVDAKRTTTKRAIGLAQLEIDWRTR